MRRFCHTIVSFIFDSIDLILQGNYRSKYKINKICSSNNNVLRILGNGQSLNGLNFNINNGIDYMVVNRHVISDSYRIIKPMFYVLADPFFFTQESGINILKLINSNTDWNLKLWVPNTRQIKRIVSKIINRNNITCVYYNSKDFDNYGKLSYYIYDQQLAMPKIQNVIVAAIMAGILCNYKRIELYGVEHNWLKWLSVGKDNKVYLKDSHFFDKKEVTPNAMKKSDGTYYTLHAIIKDYAAMFESYQKINNYVTTKHIDITIINKTPDSYIDAFQK